MTRVHFLDANIVIYATGTSPTYQQPCERILRAVRDGELLAVTSVEVLQEIMHFSLGRGRVEAGARIVRNLPKMVTDVLPVDSKDILEMVAILQAVPGLSTRDAVHAAVMKRHNLDRIITADRHFASIPDIVALDPRDVAASLGA
ncbi:MAG: type II toxin-antitoxin system VapC family toxin [Armatimonadia bacterium]